MPVRAIIEGQPVLLVIDIQQGDFDRQDHDTGKREDDGIPTMPGYFERISRTRKLVDAAHETGVPIVFVKEIHRPDHVDFGRELDGNEDVHCIETDPSTEVAREMDCRSTDYVIGKRRYSCFFGTDLEILLKGLKADTLVLTGGLTDVCVHYTFVDGHQHDYFCRVIEDCVGGSSRRAHEGALEAMEYLQTGARRSLDEMIAAFNAHSAARPAA
ncbi:MAG: cysteine hydrolase [Pseudomonadota bacterium]